MGEMRHVPYDHVLLLDALVVLVVSEVAPGAEGPRHIFGRACAPNRHVMVAEVIPFAVVFER